MEALIGTILGAILAGGAMLLNSAMAARLTREREERAERRRLLEKQLDQLIKLYEDALHSSDRLIRNKGRDSGEQLERFYRIDLQLRLHSTEEIRKAFGAVRSAVTEMAANLPDLPTEFVPKFEEDHHRQARLERREEAERLRDEKAREYQPKCWKRHRELARLMREDLESRRHPGRAASDAAPNTAPAPDG